MALEQRDEALVKNARMQGVIKRAVKSIPKPGELPPLLDAKGEPVGDGNERWHHRTRREAPSERYARETKAFDRLTRFLRALLMDTSEEQRPLIYLLIRSLGGAEEEDVKRTIVEDAADVFTGRSGEPFDDDPVGDKRRFFLEALQQALAEGASVESPEAHLAPVIEAISTAILKEVERRMSLKQAKELEARAKGKVAAQEAI